MGMHVFGTIPLPLMPITSFSDFYKYLGLYCRHRNYLDLVRSRDPVEHRMGYHVDGDSRPEKHLHFKVELEQNDSTNDIIKPHF